MSVFFETGYSLPSGDEPLTHARILHARNWRNPHAFSTSPGNPDYPVSALSNSLTYEVWRPFENTLPDTVDLGVGWTVEDVTVVGTNVMDEGTTTNFHSLSYPVTFTADGWVFGVIVESIDCPEVFLHTFDGTTVSRRWFNLTDGTVGSGTGGATDAAIRDLGNGRYLCRIMVTAVAGTGFVKIQMGEGGESNNYTGENRQLRVISTFAHTDQAFLTMRNLGAKEADVLCIAGHNIGSRGGSIVFSHDDNGDGNFTQIETITPLDDSPIMLIFDPVTSEDWRIRIDNAAMPQAAVVKVGKTLQMERPIYGGHSPLDYGRRTEYRTNVSETGETLGITKQRTSLTTSYEWQHISASWVRSNWGDFQRAVEDDTVFIAWRPDTFGEVGFGRVTGTPSASNMGLRDLMTVGFSFQGYSHD